MYEYDFIFGIRLFYAFNRFNLDITKNIHIRIILWIILAINLLIINFTAIFYWSQTFKNVTLIQNAIIKVDTFHFWLYYHALVFKITPVGLLVSSLRNHLKINEIKKCYYLSFGILVWTIIGILKDLLVIDLLTGSSKRLRRLLGLSDTATCLIFAIKMFQNVKFNWFITSDIIYLIIFYALFKAKTNLLSSIGFNINRRLQIVSIQEVCKKISNLHSMFESAFSIFPFITISYLFFTIGQDINHMKSVSEISPLAGWFVFDSLIKITSSLALIIITNHLELKLKSCARDICENIQADQKLEIFDKFVLMKRINSCVNSPVTGWGMFTIDLTLILAFLSSTVTFTILFISD